MAKDTLIEEIHEDRKHVRRTFKEIRDVLEKAETKEDLIEALRRTLDCPMVTQRALPPPSQSYLDIIRLASQGALRRPNH